MPSLCSQAVLVLPGVPSKPGAQSRSPGAGRGVGSPRLRAGSSGVQGWCARTRSRAGRGQRGLGVRTSRDRAVVADLVPLLRGPQTVLLLTPSMPFFPPGPPWRQRAPWEGRGARREGKEGTARPLDTQHVISTSGQQGRRAGLLGQGPSEGKGERRPCSHPRTCGSPVSPTGPRRRVEAEALRRTDSPSTPSPGAAELGLSDARSRVPAAQRSR